MKINISIDVEEPADEVTIAPEVTLDGAALYTGTHQAISYAPSYNLIDLQDIAVLTNGTEYAVYTPKFCKRMSLDPSNVSKVLSGKAKSHKGWRLADPGQVIFVPK